MYFSELRPQSLVRSLIICICRVYQPVSYRDLRPQIPALPPPPPSPTPHLQPLTPHLSFLIPHISPTSSTGTIGPSYRHPYTTEHSRRTDTCRWVQLSSPPFCCTTQCQCAFVLLLCLFSHLPPTTMSIDASANILACIREHDHHCPDSLLQSASSCDCRSLQERGSRGAARLPLYSARYVLHCARMDCTVLHCTALLCTVL